MRIPSELWFSHRSVLRASAVARVLLDDPVVKKLIEEDQAWAVIIGLLYERTNEYSPWLPYMRFMRRQESTVWWTEPELAETHSPHVIAETHKIQTDIRNVYQRLFPHLADTCVPPASKRPRVEVSRSRSWCQRRAGGLRRRAPCALAGSVTAAPRRLQVPDHV